MVARGSRTTIVFAAVVVIALAAFFGLRAVWNHAQTASPHCDIGEFRIDTEQASVAAAMVGAVSKHDPPVSSRAAMLVLAAGLQESKLRNLAPGQGDRDSVGVLQQRPSQGWGGGDATRLNDVTEATEEFLDALTKIKGWQTLPAAEAIQKVQISADGSAYAKHEAEAQALANALLGKQAAAISCSFDKPTLVAPTATVVSQLRRQLPVTAPTVDGRVIRVPDAHWQTAAWFVANADRLGVDSVAYAGKRWSRTDGWQDDSSAGSNAVVATMATV